MIDILEEIGQAAVLEQLAEECCELGQAALKSARFVRGENPTPVSEEDLSRQMVEEFSDVMLVWAVLTGDQDQWANAPKLKRWIERIEAAKNGQD